jgi:hypothetical protein
MNDFVSTRQDPIRPKRTSWNKGLTKDKDARLIKSKETRIKMSKSRIGIVYSDITKKRMSDAKKKNPTKFWSGKKRPGISKILLKGIEKRSGKNHYEWKGDDVGYISLHKWVVKQLGKAIKCSNNINHKAKKFFWANISGEYKRDISDWHELCPSCNKLDGIPINKRFNKNNKEIITL